MSCEDIQAKTRQSAQRDGNGHTTFIASQGWVHKFMRCNELSLHCRTTICRRSLAEYEEGLMEFQWHVIRLWCEKDYMLGQIRNSDQNRSTRTCRATRLYSKRVQRRAVADYRPRERAVHCNAVLHHKWKKAAAVQCFGGKQSQRTRIPQTK